MSFPSNQKVIHGLPSPFIFLISLVFLIITHKDESTHTHTRCLSVFQFTFLSLSLFSSHSHFHSLFHFSPLLLFHIQLSCILCHNYLFFFFFFRFSPPSHCLRISFYHTHTLTVSHTHTLTVSLTHTLTLFHSLTHTQSLFLSLSNCSFSLSLLHTLSLSFRSKKPRICFRFILQTNWERKLTKIFIR